MPSRSAVGLIQRAKYRLALRTGRPSPVSIPNLKTRSEPDPFRIEPDPESETCTMHAPLNPYEMNDLWKADLQRELKALEHRPWVTQLADEPRPTPIRQRLGNAIARIGAAPHHLILSRLFRPHTTP
jgi:hypothetical protein